MRSVKMLAVIALVFTGVLSSRAGQVVVTDGTADAEFRRTVDPSPRAAFGTASFRITKSGGKQTCSVTVENLTETDFAIYVGASPTPDTNSLITSVAPLNRTNFKRGNWSRHMTGIGGAPLEFDVPNLSDLSGGSLYVASAVDSALIQGVTNITGCVTNIVDSTTTNITGCVTNFYVGIPINAGGTGTVSAILWAPIPPIISDPSSFSYRSKGRFGPPEGVAPSPNVNVSISIKFNAKTGNSLLDIRAKNTIGGQTYTLFVANDPLFPPTVMISAGEFVGNESGVQQRFLRDTRFGDPLPQQVRDVVELSGRIFQIRDAFGNIHVEGTIP